MGGPSSKAKYYLLTDSEPVPWGKGEKNPGEGSEIDPETVCVQSVGAYKSVDNSPTCVKKCQLPSTGAKRA